jgi:hypothetical protein
MPGMRILTARFTDGHLQVPPESFREGDTVTILVPEAEEGFHLTPDEKAVLLRSISQAERGEVVDGWRLLDELAD